jgi:hypothetical protein
MSEMSSAAVTAEPARHSTGRWSFNSSKGARHGQSREFGAAPWRVPVHSQQCSLRSNKYVRPRLARFLTGLFAIALLLSAAGPGFRSRRQLDEHFAKHGAEFGRISEHEYLRLAQELRDAPFVPGGPILEARRPNGEFSRFDRRKGYFGAYNPDRTIRTFFIPNNGERYFRRQAERPY